MQERSNSFSVPISSGKLIFGINSFLRYLYRVTSYRSIEEYFGASLVYSRRVPETVVAARLKGTLSATMQHPVLSSMAPLVSRYAKRTLRNVRKPVAYLVEPLGEGKRVRKKKKKRGGEIGGRGMARAKLSGKEVAPITQLQLRFRFCSWLPSGLLLGSQPILTRSYRTMQSGRCHPKTNDSVPISPGGLHSSPTRQPSPFSSRFARLVSPPKRIPPRSKLYFIATQ